MSGTFVPFYAIAVATFLTLCAAMFFVARKVLHRRKVACPGHHKDAEILVEQSKATPWAKSGTLDVTACSLLPGQPVDCAKQCLGCVDSSAL